MSAQRILVAGPESTANLAAALLATRWGGPGKEVVVVSESEEARPILLRPGHEKAHGHLGLGLADLIDGLGAAPAFSYEAVSAGGEISMPFSAYGVARSGVDFHHFWQRGCDLGETEALERYSLAFALKDRSQPLAPDTLSKLPVTYGLQLDSKAYSERVGQIARSRGVMLADGSAIDASLVLNLRDHEQEPSWRADELIVANGESIAGLDWSLGANAVLRFLSLPESIDPQSPERAEFNRLAVNEAERIQDMIELLSSKDPQQSGRLTLRRKVDVFAACGRIPTEDFEVFAQSEWLTALWARDIRPRRFDRLAEQMPDRALVEWLGSLRSQVDQISSTGVRA